MVTQPKACEKCQKNRIEIGKRFYTLPAWRRYIGSMLIFLPLIVSLPFVAVGAWVLYAHLRVLGAKNLKSYSDFLPEKSSFRYSALASQITFDFDPTAPWANVKAFWRFNCNYYCPLSVGLYEWSTYLVKAVENFWCPFFHSRKTTYAESAIDKSYWHLRSENASKLNPEDHQCAIWYDDDRQ